MEKIIYKYKNKCGFCCHKGINTWKQCNKIKCDEKNCPYIKECKVEDEVEDE